MTEHAIKFNIGTFDQNDIDNIRAMFLHRCETDRWSAETRHCFGTITSFDDGVACERLMTKEQLDLLEQDIKGMGSTMAHPKPTL